MSIDPIILLTLRASVTLLFASAIAHKLWNAAEFQQTLRGYLQGFSANERGLQKPLFLMIVVLEFIVLGLCLFPSTHIAAGLLASGVLLVYAAVMAVNLLRRNVLIDCGCSWGKSRHMLHPALLVRNVMLALAALAITLPVNDRELFTLDVISVVFATVTAAVLYTAGNKILSLGFTERMKIA